MVCVYFDQNNIFSFIASHKDELYNDCVRMLKKKCKLKLTFAKNELKQTENDDNNIKELKLMLLSLITKMNDGVGKYEADKVYYAIEYPVRPLKTNLYQGMNFDQLSSVYLLADEKIDSIKECGFMLCGGVGQEIEVLKELILDDDYQFNKRIDIREMKDWKLLSRYASPCTDIVFVDQYLYSSPEIVEYNAEKLLLDLCKWANNCKVNIVIFTQPSYYNKFTQQTFSPDWEKNKSSLKKKLERKIGKEPNITFVLSSDLGEHDRTLFTNYKSYESGDTLNYFDSKGFISKGRYLNVHSNIDNDIYEQNKKFIIDMQNLINNLLRSNKDLIVGDKKSCFLKFEQNNEINLHT